MLPVIPGIQLDGFLLLSGLFCVRDQADIDIIRAASGFIVVVIPDLHHRDIDLLSAVGDVAGPGFGLSIENRFRIGDSIVIERGEAVSRIR